jgi:hypothetical protein
MGKAGGICYGFNTYQGAIAKRKTNRFLKNPNPPRAKR